MYVIGEHYKIDDTNSTKVISKGESDIEYVKLIVGEGGVITFTSHFMILTVKTDPFL